MKETTGLLTPIPSADGPPADSRVVSKGGNAHLSTTRTPGDAETTIDDSIGRVEPHEG